MSRVFKEARYKIHNRGVAPTWFLDKLTDLIQSQLKKTPSYFEKNEHYDVYSSMFPQLGPWTSLEHRAAALANYLEILAGYESSWNPVLGRDETNPNVDSPWNEESSLYQTSADSIVTKEMKDLFEEYAHMPFAVTDEVARKFISLSKENFDYCTLHTILVLRHTINHHGPAKSKAVNKWLRREAVDEFQKFISASPSTPIENEAEAPWMKWMEKNIGQAEIPGSRANPFFTDCFKYTNDVSKEEAASDETPTCAATACAALEKNGYKSPHSSGARNFRNFGKPVRLDEIQYGDFIVFKWASGQRHVTFYSKRVDDVLLECTGGNQSNMLKRSNYNQKFIEYIGRPIEKV